MRKKTVNIRVKIVIINNDTKFEEVRRKFQDLVFQCCNKVVKQLLRAQ